MKRLKPGPFVDSLARKPPADLDELRVRVAGYINMEEVSTTRRSSSQPQVQPQSNQQLGLSTQHHHHPERELDSRRENKCQARGRKELAKELEP